MTGLRIADVSPAIFAIAAALLFLSILLDVLPNGMIGALAVMMVVGGLFAFAGDNTPIVKGYFGGAPLVCVFGGAALVYFGILPETVIANVTTFMKDGGFLNFYIAALITGSILGMDAQLLTRAGIRYVFPLVGGVLCAMFVTSLVGALIYTGWRHALMYVCFPIIGGGMGAGAVPMSEIVSSMSLDVDAATALSKFVPALALGNIFAIVFAGLLNKLGELRPQLTGNGVLMKGFVPEREKARNYSVDELGVGLLAACLFFISGRVAEHFIPALHSYALMIITVAVLKISGIVPTRIEQASSGWYKFVVTNFTAALLVGIGIAFTDLNQVMQTASPAFFLLVFTTVFTIVIASGYIGTFVGFHFVESALTSGLGMADMGGTGDVAVLSAAKRMELMPFMQISSRLGGALVLVLVSILAKTLLS